MPGSFQTVCEAVGVNNLNLPGHLYFGVLPGANISVEELGLRDDCEAVATVLQTHVGLNNPAFRALFEELLATAQVGLVGAGANPAAAGATLNAFKERLVSSLGPGVRKRYLSSLGRRAIAMATLFVALGLFASRYASVIELAPDECRNYCFMLSASMLTVWASFAARRKFSFEEIFLPESDMLAPLHRLVFSAICTLLLAIICSIKMAGFSVGSFSTDNVGTSTKTALVFGALLGFGERFLGDAIMPHVSRILGGLGKGRQSNIF